MTALDERNTGSVFNPSRNELREEAILPTAPTFYTMTIKKLIKNEQEYVDWVRKTFLENLGERNIWREEDLPKLEPFFKFSDSGRGSMTEEEGKSFEHYRKCLEDYADETSTLQQILDGFSFEELLEYFVLKLDEPCDENGDPLSQEEYDLNYLAFDRENCEPITYPMVAVLFIDRSFDRVGSYKAFQLTFVEHKMFDDQSV
jgi:hypothetical protein